MGFSISKAFAVPEDALRLRGERAKVLAYNIANADTPGYQARDFDFRAAMASEHPGLRSGSDAAGLPVRPVATHHAHIGSGGFASGSGGPTLAYRNATQPSLDQNTVETHIEQAAFADNAVQYQAALTLLSGRIRGLLTAITGQ